MLCKAAQISKLSSNSLITTTHWPITIMINHPDFAPTRPHYYSTLLANPRDNAPIYLFHSSRTPVTKESINAASRSPRNPKDNKTADIGLRAFLRAQFGERQIMLGVSRARVFCTRGKPAAPPGRPLSGSFFPESRVHLLCRWNREIPICKGRRSETEAGEARERGRTMGHCRF